MGSWSGWYVRRRSAELALRVCQRRGWEPTLRRTLGVWIVRVEIPRLGEVGAPAWADVAPAPNQSLASTREP